MKTSLQLVVVAVTVTSLMLVAVAACGKQDGAGTKSGAAARTAQTSTTSALVAARASCTMVAELGTCNEYRSENAPRAANELKAGSGSSFGLEKSLCEGFHGKFSTAGCSTDGQIASCLMSDGELKRYYGAAVAGEHALTVAEAKADCESDIVKGTLTAGPAAALPKP